MALIPNDPPAPIFLEKQPPRVVPTDQTDAAPPERNSRGLVFLAGAIKYWWLRSCTVCGRTETYEGALSRCPVHGDTMHELWGGSRHEAYVAYRNDVRRWLIAAGYLTYAPHEAFKGTWTDAAQAVNDAGIAAADLMLVLSPLGIWTPGTDDEAAYAKRIGTPVLYTPPETTRSELLSAVVSALRSV